jgi:hypothetical protein
MRSTALALLLCPIALSPAPGWASPRTPVGHTPDVHVPVAPSLFNVSGQPHLAYELHITNLRPNELLLRRLQVFGAPSGQTNSRSLIADYGDEDLAPLLGRPGLTGDNPDKRLLAGGMRAIVYLWLPLPAGARAPARLTHRIEFESIRPGSRTPGLVEGIDVTVASATVNNLGPPLRGGPWVAIYDPAMMGGHRTSIYTINGRARIPARYAIDWVRLDAGGGRARADTSAVANWHGFGADVLAVADGVVVDARDDIPGAESIAASQSGIPLENASGNYVVLKISEGAYAIYEHLKHGSVRVQPGDAVKRGRVVAQLGNTGSSSAGPHLHFHVADGAALLGTEGIPWSFDRFDVIGAFDTIEATRSDQPWPAAKAATGGQRRNELPAANVVVLFD